MASGATARVYVDMVADLLHAGHISFLKQAKAKAREEFPSHDVQLLVGVHSDEDVLGYKRLPILTMSERVSVVESLSVVDDVIPWAPLTPTEAYLAMHNVDLVVHGDDVSKENMHMMYRDAIRMGIYRMVPYTRGVSTTDIIGRIRERLQG
jgi:cytidyltransferase-like protein